MLHWLFQRLPPPPPGVVLGVGDDGAVLDPGHRGPLVLATDQTLEDVHFTVGPASWRQVGRKALARNLSDLAAMGARPWVALLSVAWPGQHPDEGLRELFQGLLEHGAENETALVGGDLSRSPSSVCVTVTVAGLLEGRTPLTRGGASVGDELFVTGALGASGTGHHLTFTPRWREGLALAQSGVVHAALDLSDGLARDLPRMTSVSAVGARIDGRRLPRRAGANLDQCLHDGEDFELLFAAAPGTEDILVRALAPLAVTRIGVCTEGPLEMLDEEGAVTRWPEGGYEHTLGD